mmetsp:Transcript_13288/g.28834  ORF Transcript_13288/g.28834 Transcript_13288/m.28834 type:complete len:354 (+) Transcript_13288:1252-2313(+)
MTRVKGVSGHQRKRRNCSQQPTKLPFYTIHWLASIVMLTTTTTKVTRMESILCLSKASIFYFLSRPNISSLIPSLSITYHISVSINCAHLHPQYGIPTPAEQLAQLKDEEDEVDVNLEEYKKRRDEARRSPYPSVIVEVMSTPPPDFGSGARRVSADEAMEAAVAAAKENVHIMEGSSTSKKVDADADVTSEDVKRLEALFGMSAADKSSSVDDTFYDALGEAFGNEQIIPETPLSMAQTWVLNNDPFFNELTSTFTNSNTRHVDAAYEYIFHNLAMLQNDDSTKRGQKSYVVLPNFLPTSATSFDRFAGQVSNIIRVMPSMAEKVMVSTFHPEHVVKSTRAPVPIVVIPWKE